MLQRVQYFLMASPSSNALILFCVPNHVESQEVGNTAKNAASWERKLLLFYLLPTTEVFRMSHTASSLAWG